MAAAGEGLGAGAVGGDLELPQGSGRVEEIFSMAALGRVGAWVGRSMRER